MNKISDDFGTRTANELALGLRSGKWTSTELTRYFLKRIAEADVDVHAVPFTFEDSALAQAAVSDERQRKGQSLGPLDGLPMTLKDSLRVKDLRSTYGLLPFRNHRPKNDSLLAKALRDEGIVFLGRTAVPTGAFDWNCRNQVYAECVNPFDHSRTPGGSSGGAAAAIALGLSPLELGSDLGGSIRYPAHCCGIYGLRTTDGLLPVHDIGPEGIVTAFKHMVALGPMAKNLTDLKLLLNVFERRLQLKGQRALTASKTIAYTQEMLSVGLESESQSIFDSYLATLQQRGFVLEEVESPVEPEEMYKVWGIVAGYEYTNTIPKLFRNGLIKRALAWWLLDRRLGQGKFSTHFRSGLFATHAQYNTAMAEREIIFKKVEAFFTKHSTWILPVARGPAFLLKDSGHSILSEGKEFSYADYVGAFTVPTVSLGTPVLTIPIGFTSTGLPIGIQAFGPRFSDSSLIDFAEQLRASETSFTKLT